MRFYEMNKFGFHFPAFIFLTVFFEMIFINFVPPVKAQEPTPTVSSGGIYITVLGDEPFANVRIGPSSSIYPIVGKLLPGETAPALGRSPGGDWIQIEYSGAPNNHGWVYSPLVQLSSGTLQIVEPPPTPLPPPTSTIDPTLEAQFNIIPTSTRLPTFTPPPPLVSPSYEVDSSFGPEIPATFPMAIVIMSLGVTGLVTLVVSLLIPRK